MKKIIKSVCLILILITTVILSVSCQSQNKTDKNKIDENDRILNIVNETNQTLKEISIVNSDEIEIKKLDNEKELDKERIQIEITKDYNDYTTFIITLTDIYDIIYQKEITDVKQKGITVVEFTKDDYVKQDGDVWKNIDKFLNGD